MQETELFDLRKTIRVVAETAELIGPVEIASRVAEMIPEHELRAVVDQLLPSYVRLLLGKARQPTADLAASAPAGGASADGNLQLPLPVPGRQDQKATARAAARMQAANSVKVTTIREAWRKHLAGQYHVGGGAWKELRVCTPDDVAFLAAERRRHAAANLARAEVFDRLHQAMITGRVTDVGSLPEAVLSSILVEGNMQ